MVVFYLITATFFVEASIEPLREEAANISLANGAYGATEKPKFVLDSDGIVRSDSSTVATDKLDANKGQIEVKLTSNDVPIEGAVTITSQLKGDNERYLLTVSQGSDFRPGKYRLTATMRDHNSEQTVTQDFLWGVLALNLDKSTYKPNETVTVGMGVLDDKGRTLCDSRLVLEITGPGGESVKLSSDDKSIIVAETCQDKLVTNQPDYKASFTPREAGLYMARLTATTDNGERTAKQQFEVTDSAPVVINRFDTATRIYPIEKYTVRATINTQTLTADGISERLPASFSSENAKLVVTDPDGLKREIAMTGTSADEASKTQLLHWDSVGLKPGSVAELTYTYLAPPISPEFYLLGSIELWNNTIRLDESGLVERTVVYTEPRAWQVAADAPDGTGMLVYDEDGAGNTTPHYRTWSGTDLSAESQAQDDEDATDDTNHTIVEAAPKRNEYLQGRLNHLGELDIQLFDGTNWVNGTSAPTNGDFTTAIGTTNDIYRGFDIAYENSTGDGMVVYESSSTGDAALKYRTWDGSAWSGEGTIDYSAVDEGNAVATWVECEADYGSDNILCAWREATNLGIYGARWDGTQWLNIAAINTANGIATRQDFDVAWEGTSGEGMVVYANGTTIDASTYTPGTGWADTSSITAITGAAQWINIAGSPNNNYIAAIINNVASTSAADIDVDMWNGSDWTSVTVPTTMDDDINNNGFANGSDVVWEQGGGDRALFVWRDGSVVETSLVYMVYDVSANQFQAIDDGGTVCGLTEGGAGTTEQVTNLTAAEDSNGPCRVLGAWADSISGINLNPDPGSNKIMVIAEDLTQDLAPEMQLWNGVANGTWLTQTTNMGTFEADLSTGVTLTTSLPTKAYDFAFRQSNQVTVTTIGTQTAAVSRGSSTNYAGGAFVITGLAATVNVTSIKITEQGTINASTNLDNILLRYESDSGTPYDCNSVAYGGAETQYGSTDTDGFDGADGSSTFTGSVAVTPTSAMCVYIEYDIGSGASGGETIEFQVSVPSADVVISAGTVGPETAVAISGTSTVNFRISGTCKKYDRSTDCDGDDGADEVKVAYDASAQATVDATIDGAWAIDLTAPSSGQVVTVYINGETTETSEAVAATKYDGSGDITGVELVWEHLVLGSGDNPSLTHTNLSQWDNGASADEDIFFDISAGSDLTVDSTSQSSQEKLLILSGATLTSGSGEDITTNKIEVVGTYTGGSNTLTIEGTGSSTARPFYLNGGTFNTPATTIFNGDGDADIQHTTYTALQLTPSITSNRAYTLTGAPTINGNFDINPTASSTTKTLTVNAAGTITVAASATTTITGTTTGASVLDLRPASTDYNLSTGLINITNTGSGGTLDATSAASTITLTGTSGTLWTQTGTYTITSGTPTVVFSPDAAVTLTSNNAITFYNLSLTPAISTAGRTYTFGTSGLTINGDFLIQPSGTQLLTVNPAAHMTVASGKTTTVSKSGSATSTLDLRPVSTDYNLTTGLLNVATGGTLDAGSAASVITLNGTAGTLLTKAGTFTQGSSDVQVTPASGTPTLLSAATTFHKLTINSSATVINAGAVITTQNASGADLTITAGVLNDGGNQMVGPGTGNGTFTIGASGSFCTGGTASATNATCNSGATSTTAMTLPDFQTYSFNTTSTFRYLSDNVAQTVDTTPSYGNLAFTPVITVAAIYTFEGAATVNGNFDINPDGASVLAFTVKPAGHITVGTSKTTTITRTGSNVTSTLDLMPVATPYNLTTGTLTIGSGATLDATDATSAVNIAGNYANSGTFTAGSSTVTLNGAVAQTLSGTMTSGSAFYNLTISNSSGTSASDCERTSFVASVDFDAAATSTNNYTITTSNVRVEYNTGSTYAFNNINWAGTASNLIYFRNSAASSTWLLSVSGTQTAVSYINVSRSDATPGNVITANDGTNVDCSNNTDWTFAASDPAFNQVNYRFGSGTANDIDYTGAPAENTALTVSTTGQDFRLRMAINVSTATLTTAAAQNFKLRFGEKPGGGCSAATYADVATGSGTIRYLNIGGLADGDNISLVSGDPNYTGTERYQDYEESNNFTNSVVDIAATENGIWDFALENYSSLGSKVYCFKITESDGTDLGTYTNYPEIIIDEELTFSLDSTTKDFGTITPGSAPTDLSSTLTSTTNAASGYQVTLWATQLLTRTGGGTITNWSGSNASPTTFSGAGDSRFGYTTDDSNLSGGTVDRFTNGGAKYAGFALAGPGDIVADETATPIASQAFTVGYRLRTSSDQTAGSYATTLIYINTATY